LISKKIRACFPCTSSRSAWQAFDYILTMQQLTQKAPVVLDGIDGILQSLIIRYSPRVAHALSRIGQNSVFLKKPVRRIKDFIHAGEAAEDSLFTKWELRSINRVASTFGRKFIEKGPTDRHFYHGAPFDIVPWANCSVRKKGANTQKSFLSVNQEKILYEEFEKLLSPKTQTRQYRSCIQFHGTIKSGFRKIIQQHTR